jgi:hypothetical protein
MKTALVASKEVSLQVNAEKNDFVHVKETDCRTKLAQNRDKWQTLVNTVMNLRNALDLEIF